MQRLGLLFLVVYFKAFVLYQRADVCQALGNCCKAFFVSARGPPCPQSRVLCLIMGPDLLLCTHFMLSSPPEILGGTLPRHT